MTAAVELSSALAAAEWAVYYHDRNRDAAERLATVHRMTAHGASTAEIGESVGVTQRHVARLRSSTPRPGPPLPHVPGPGEISAERAAALEGAVDFALALADRLRDENPALVWLALDRLSRRSLQELAVVLLAAVRSDLTVSELFGWVLDLPAAQWGES